jgi:methionyl-tRNA formyltransferase
MISKKIIFFGNERLATAVKTSNPVLHSLLNNGYIVESIILNQDNFASRKENENEIEILARKYNIPCLKPRTNSEIRSIIKNSDSEIAILVAYGKLIPESIIELFPYGIINLHPSLLPDKRGTTPIETTIKNGDTQSGVSVMKLTAGMDSGPIFAQKSLKLSVDESKQNLSDSLNKLGAELIIEVLPSILAKTIVPEDQSKLNISITSLINKSDGIIDWNDSAEQIERNIRAYYNWPRSVTSILGKRVIITKAKVINSSFGTPGDIKSENKNLIISCGDKSLEILNLIPENKKEMTGAAFLGGYNKQSLL